MKINARIWSGKTSIIHMETQDKIIYIILNIMRTYDVKLIPLQLMSWLTTVTQIAKDRGKGLTLFSSLSSL